MAETLTALQIADLRDEGAEIEFDDDILRKIEGFEKLVAEIRSLVEVQRANAGADMLRSETQTQLISAVQKLASRNPGGGMSEEVLEELIEQLVQRPEREPNSVYVFDIERNQTTGLIAKITATPMPVSG